LAPAVEHGHRLASRAGQRPAPAGRLPERGRPIPFRSIGSRCSFAAPQLGKADVYERWAEASDGKQAYSLVVVSLGTTQDQRPLTPDEIAGPWPARSNASSST